MKCFPEWEGEVQTSDSNEMEGDLKLFSSQFPSAQLETSNSF